MVLLRGLRKTAYMNVFYSGGHLPGLPSQPYRYILNSPDTSRLLIRPQNLPKAREYDLYHNPKSMWHVTATMLDAKIKILLIYFVS